MVIIELVGFEEENAKLLRNRIYPKLNFAAADGDSIVEETRIVINSTTSKNQINESKPYVDIRATNIMDAEKIAVALRQLIINLDVVISGQIKYVEIRPQRH